MVKRYVLLLMMRREEESEPEEALCGRIFRGAGARLHWD